MKTKVEIHGYEIEIEEKDGLITVKAEKDSETIEEFSLQVGEESQVDMQDEEDMEIKGFGEFGEEDDFEGQGQAQMQDEEDMEEVQMQDGEDMEEESEEDMEEEMPTEEETEGKLESFQSFINRKRK
jgi:hypothetical protein